MCCLLGVVSAKLIDVLGQNVDDRAELRNLRRGQVADTTPPTCCSRLPNPDEHRRAHQRDLHNPPFEALHEESASHCLEVYGVLVTQSWLLVTQSWHDEFQ